MERNSSKRGARGFTFRELATATTNFKVTNLIGEGGFGRVYKGRLETDQIVAIKKLDRNGIQGNQEFIVEVLMLSLLHHSNLVRLIGYCADGDQRILVYEYMPMGSLEDHLFVASNTLWPEFEIISEDECVFDTDESEENISSSLVSKDQMDESVKSLMDTFEGDGDKKAWASFEERISKAPEQVLRYSQDEKAKPLWPMSSGRPSKADILKCNYCNGPLCYELQILPQLLYYFGVKNDADSLDWATIVVYTCADSCETSMAYNEEFAWVQLSPSVALPS